MAIVSFGKGRKYFPTGSRRFAATRRWMKRHAQRAYRRAAKQAVQAGRDVNETPRLTDWDLI